MSKLTDDSPTSREDVSSDMKAYPGSCHCGDVQYQVKLKFPPVHDATADSIRIYKCNCSTCQKMGYFHCRPVDPANDYILTSPDPEQLGDYRCFEKKHGWIFCKKCGVRVLGLGGSWEYVHVDFPSVHVDFSSGQSLTHLQASEARH
jgi:hypothetical protein